MRHAEMFGCRWLRGNTTVTTVDTGVDCLTECIVEAASTTSTDTDLSHHLRGLIAVLPELRKGRIGWIYFAAGIVVWDVLSEEDEQLTHAFRRGLQTPEGRLFIGATWVVVTAHLFDALPKEYDPIHLIAHHIFAAPRRRREHHDV